MKKEEAYSRLIHILNAMYDDEKVRKQDAINWAELEKEAIESIIDKLYHLENDIQRSGFLHAVFNRIFNDGKAHNINLLELKGKDGFENEFDFQYIENCKWLLNGLICEVSDACLQYAGVDFPKIIMKNIHLRPDENKLNFTLYRRSEIKTKTKHPKKNQPSMVRAKAFCIALMQQSGKVNFLKGNVLKRNEIMTFAQKTWDKNGRTIYNECLNIISEKNPINNFYKEDNLKEYEIGLKLYREMFPD